MKSSNQNWMLEQTVRFLIKVHERMEKQLTLPHENFEQNQNNSTLEQCIENTCSNGRMIKQEITLLRNNK